jgi:hypothetical protein
MGGLLAMCGIFMLLWPARKSSSIRQVTYNANAGVANP